MHAAPVVPCTADRMGVADPEPLETDNVCPVPEVQHNWPRARPWFGRAPAPCTYTAGALRRGLKRMRRGVPRPWSPNFSSRSRSCGSRTNFIATAAARVCSRIATWSGPLKTRLAVGHCGNLHAPGTARSDAKVVPRVPVVGPSSTTGGVAPWRLVTQRARAQTSWRGSDYLAGTENHM